MRVLAKRTNGVIKLLTKKDSNGIEKLLLTKPRGDEYKRSGLKFNGFGLDTGIGNGRNMATNPISIECWCIPKVNEAVVIGALNTTTQRLYIGTINGKWDIGIQNSSWWSGTGQVPFIVGKLTHVALVLDGTKATLFVDGIETISKTYTSYTLAGTIRIGNNAANAWSDVISAVRLWDGAITQQQIKANMYSYLPANYPNLIEQWKLNEGLGSIAYGTKGNNGTITGATWTTPSLMNWIGKQLKLNGVDQYVTVANSTSLNTKLLTIEAQVRVPNSVDTWNTVVGKAGQYLLRFTQSGTIVYFTVWLGGSPRYVNFAHGKAVGTRFQLAAVYDGTNLKLLIDGVQVTQSSSATGGLDTTTNPLLIGMYEGNGQYYNDVIDELRIWNVGRTATEILENKDRTLDRHPNLVLNMGFESGYWDASGFGNHGTAVGTPIIEVTDNDKLLLNAPIN